MNELSDEVKLAQQLADALKAIAALEKRVAALESRPPLIYVGKLPPPEDVGEPDFIEDDTP